MREERSIVAEEGAEHLGDRKGEKPMGKKEE